MARGMTMTQDYESAEEFIYQHCRYPNSEEWKYLNALLWEKYLNQLDASESLVAIENDKLQKEFKQSEVIKRVAASTEKFKATMRSNKAIISVGYCERWGDYRICVTVNCKTKKRLYLFRQNIPNFFEGWYIELFRASPLQRILFYFRKPGCI